MVVSLQPQVLSVDGDTITVVLHGMVVEAVMMQAMTPLSTGQDYLLTMMIQLGR